MRSSLYVTLMSGASAPTGALALLAGYDQGFAFLANAAGGRGQVAVKDTGTPANNLSNAAATDLITNAGTSPKLVKQTDGTYAWSPHNLALYSELLTTGWTAPGSNVVIVAADEMREAATSSSHYIQSPNLTSTISGATYTVSVELKKGDGATAPDIIQVVLSSAVFGANVWQNVNLATGALGTGGSANVDETIEDVGDGYYRVTLTGVATSAGVNNVYLAFTDNNDSLGRVPSYAGAVTANVYVRRWEVQRGATRVDPYIPTTTAAVFEPAFEWDSTFGASGGWRFLIESAATGLALYNRDLTNAAWTKSNTTPAKNVTGIDGVANSASRLTADANNGTCLQAVTSTSAARVFSPFVKRITGSGTVEVTLDNGSTWTDITSSLSTTEWYRVSAKQTLANPTVGFRLGTSGDVIAVDVAGLENNTVASSPIPTYGSTVTMAADDPTALLSAMPHDATQGTLIWAGESKDVDVTNRGLVILDDGTNNERIRLLFNSAATTAYVVVDGGVNQAAINVGTVADNTVGRMAVAWAANDFISAFDGALATQDTSGTLPTVTTMRFGAEPGPSSGLNGYIDEIIYIPERLPNATLQALTS